MTCIVGLIDERGDVHLGGDSLGVGGWAKYHHKGTKVWKVGDVVLGAAGACRIGQTLRNHFEWPEGGFEGDWVTRWFAPKLRELLKTQGLAFQEKSGDHEGEDAFNGSLLIGHGGRLFEIERGFAVLEVTDGFQAIGSGAALALGALHALRGFLRASALAAWDRPEEQIRYALDAAARFDASVEGPFSFVSTAPE